MARDRYRISSRLPQFQAYLFVLDATRKCRTSRMQTECSTLRLLFGSLARSSKVRVSKSGNPHGHVTTSLLILAPPTADPSASLRPVCTLRDKSSPQGFCALSSGQKALQGKRTTFVMCIYPTVGRTYMMGPPSAARQPQNIRGSPSNMQI